MAVLNNRIILLISPQSWGKMFISKHHYAVELARRGNTVFFLNPPSKEFKKRVVIEPVAAVPGLFIVHHRLCFPYNLKFHVTWLFHWLMQRQVKKIVKEIGQSINIVWSFDIGDLYPFRFFPKTAFKIFHPVDDPLVNTAIESGKGADIILSVTKEILDKYTMYNVPKYFINHGVSKVFLQQNVVNSTKNNTIRVGISGNLLRSDIDRPVLLQIIDQNPAIIFECWGSFNAAQSNIGANNDEGTLTFIDTLQKSPNVILHGAVSAEKLAVELQRMDAFLICYDILKDQSRGTNYHKVMEYFSTGKVIISNNITAYNEDPEMITMTKSRTTNERLPELFNYVIKNIADFNRLDLIEKRKTFAAANIYDKQIDKISHILTEQPFYKA